MQRDDRLFVLIGVGLIVLIAAVAGVLWLASTITGEPTGRVEIVVEPVPATVSPASQSTAGRAAIEARDTTTENELLRSLVERLSNHPALAAWLVTDGLVERFVASVEAIAAGYSPRDQLDFLQPVRPFVVREDEVAGLVIAVGSFRRYDLTAEVVASLDPDGAVALFRELEPMLDAKHREISWRDDPFEDRLREAVDHLLAVDVPAGQIMVERRLISYAFADGALERLTDAQRHLLRMGPANARRIQAKLRELRARFGWPEPPAPQPQAPLVADRDDHGGVDPMIRMADLTQLSREEAGDPSATEPGPTSVPLAEEIELPVDRSNPAPVTMTQANGD